MTGLLIFSRDPGPTNQLIAVAERLGQPPASGEPEGFSKLRAAARDFTSDLQIVARPPGDGLWRQAGFSPVGWAGADRASAADLLVGAGLLLTGTSDMDERGDQVLWSVASRIDIESHAVMDHPANLRMRFTTSDGKWILPDWLYVEDEAFKTLLLRAGLPAGKIRIVGELHHARIRGLAARRNSDQVAAVRKSWGAASDTTTVLFASECTREMAAFGKRSPYDEVDVLDRLIDDISHGRDIGFGPFAAKSTLIIVRPHPRDLRSKWDYLSRRVSNAPQIVVDDSVAADLALLASDVVVGMNCSLLYEAVDLKRPVLSLTGHDLSKGKTQSA